MKKAVLILAVLCAFAGFSPARAHGCAPVGPFLTCGGAVVFRSFSANFVTSRAEVVIEAVTAQGVASDGDQIDESQVCFEVFTRSYGGFQCGVPLTASIDPALRTASVKGSFVDRQFGFGKIVVDVLATATSDTPDAVNNAYERTTLDCFAADADGSSPDVLRPGTATGSVSFQRRLGRVSANATRPADAIMSVEFEPSTRVMQVFTAPMCADEGSATSHAGFSCAGIPDPFAGISCAGATSTRSASVSFARGKTKIRITGFELQIAGSPSTWGTACLEITGPRSGYVQCGDDMSVTIDPVLRSATIKGTFRSPEPGGFGAAHVNLTIAGGAGYALAPNGSVEQDAYCGDASSDVSSPTLRNTGSATGGVRFDRGLGSFAFTPSSAAPAKLAFSTEGGTLADLSPTCL